jgi:hypothetical protein
MSGRRKWAKSMDAFFILSRLFTCGLGSVSAPTDALHYRWQWYISTANHRKIRGGRLPAYFAFGPESLAKNYLVPSRQPIFASIYFS